MHKQWSCRWRVDRGDRGGLNFRLNMFEIERIEIIIHATRWKCMTLPRISIMPIYSLSTQMQMRLTTLLRMFQLSISACDSRCSRSGSEAPLRRSVAFFLRAFSHLIYTLRVRRISLRVICIRALCAGDSNGKCRQSSLISGTWK